MLKFTAQGRLVHMLLPRREPQAQDAGPPHSTFSPPPNTPAPLTATDLFSVPVDLTAPGLSCSLESHSMCGLLCLVSFTQHVSRLHALFLGFCPASVGSSPKWT